MRGSCLIYIWQEEKGKTEGQQWVQRLAQKNKNKTKKTLNQINQINNPTKTQRGQEQQVETGHKAEQDLGCKAADGGRTDWKDKMVDVHVGQRQKGNNMGSEVGFGAKRRL